MKHCTTDMVSL